MLKRQDSGLKRWRRLHAGLSSLGKIQEIDGNTALSENRTAQRRIRALARRQPVRFASSKRVSFITLLVCVIRFGGAVQQAPNTPDERRRIQPALENVGEIVLEQSL